MAAVLWAAPAGAEPQAISGPSVDTPPKEDRPGLYRLGPFYLTPEFRIGTVGVDTNVFYTATDRQTDFTASGGPGLEIVLPVRSSLLLSVDGAIDYLYFLRTTSERRLSGEGRGRVDFVGARAAAGFEGSYRRSFSRPNFEVDSRIVQDQEQLRADGHLAVGERLDLRLLGTATRLDVPEGQEFAGADLRSAYSRDTYLGRLTTAYRLTPKTWLLLEGDYQVDRFLLDVNRDADSNRVGGGFEIVSTTRLAGRAVAGVRSFRPQGRGGVGRPADILEPYANVELAYHFGPRTHLSATYNRDLQYSAFDAVLGLPVINMETYRLRLEKNLVAALDIRLFGGLTTLRSDGVIRVEVEPDEVVVGVRDDDAWEAGADLGYTFRGHLRIGVAASYVERRSTIDDFGIDGLLVGGTIMFVP
jgi:hypothetical protein